MAEKITVSIVNSSDNNVTATARPPVETEKLLKRLAHSHGVGSLLDEQGDVVLDDRLEHAGNYTYRVTGEFALGILVLCMLHATVNSQLVQTSTETVLAAMACAPTRVLRICADLCMRPVHEACA